jgi:uncharacterized membrane protein YGL010W
MQYNVMQKLSEYIHQYSEAHLNPTNIKIHNICVPAIMWSFLVLCAQVQIFNKINLATVAILLASFYYLKFKNVNLLFIIVSLSAISVNTSYYIPHAGWVAVGVFVVAWLGQFYGHKVEGKKPSFLKDLQYLLIGPVWVIHKINPQILKIEENEKDQ